MSDYDAYADQPFVLGENTWGRLIYFRPHSNNYNSLQLYIMDKSSRIKDAIEVGYWFEEEGASGLGKSFVVYDGKQTILYNKQHWTSFYMNQEGDFINEKLVDTIIAHHLTNSQIIPQSLSVKKLQEAEQVFEIKRQKQN